MARGSYKPARVAARFVLDEDDALPKEINAPPARGGEQVFRWPFKAADAPRIHARDGEEILPEGLAVGVFLAGIAVLAREFRGAPPSGHATA